MGEKLEKRFGLLTAICMVAGIVIGSGVFFKAEKVLTATAGDLPLGILAWVIGGLIMIVCAYTFSILATRYEKVNGIVDYSEAIVGEKFSYVVGWFMTVIYYPAMTAVVAWVSARYIFVLFGSNDITSGGCIALACFLMASSFALNALSPVLAGKFQVSTTVIKLIPLYLMAIIGTLVGLSNGLLVENFTKAPGLSEILAVKENFAPSVSPLLTAVVGTSFAYEGWIVATSINSELKDAKRNLPKALIIGTLIVMLTYILYYVGLAGAAENIVMIAGGEAGAKIAFSNVFSQIGGSLLFVFVAISCMGTLAGLTMGCSRGIFAIAVRGRGPKPEIFKTVDSQTGMATNSAVLGFFLTGFWLMYFYGANLVPKPWFGSFSFDSSELPIVTTYALYVWLYVCMMKKEKDLSVFKRFVVPAAAIACSLFMVYATFVSHGVKTVGCYIVIFAAVQLVGAVFYKKQENSLQ